MWKTFPKCIENNGQASLRAHFLFTDASKVDLAEYESRHFFIQVLKNTDTGIGK